MTLHTQGGIGITQATDIAEASYVSSVLSTNVLLSGILRHSNYNPVSKITLPLRVLQSRLDLPPKLQLPMLVQRLNSSEDLSHIQTEFTAAIHTTNLARIMPSPSDTSEAARRSRIRLSSVSTATSSACINTLPSNALGTRIAPEIWKTIIDKRLGNPIYSGRTFCSRCAHDGARKVLDVYGHHASICAAGEGTITRHNEFRNKLFAVLCHPWFGLQMYKEWCFPQDLHLPFAQRRRMDIVIDDLSFAPRRQAFDVTIISLHSTAYRGLRLDNAFAKAAMRKTRTYGTLCRELNMDLHTIALDIYGSIYKESETALQLVAEYLAKKRGSSPLKERKQLIATLTSWVNQTTAVAINRRHLDTCPTL